MVNIFLVVHRDSYPWDVKHSFWSLFSDPNTTGRLQVTKGDLQPHKAAFQGQTRHTRKRDFLYESHLGWNAANPRNAGLCSHDILGVPFGELLSEPLQKISHVLLKQLCMWIRIATESLAEAMFSKYFPKSSSPQWLALNDRLFFCRFKILKRMHPQVKWSSH